jgi:hypothetical protein
MRVATTFLALFPFLFGPASFTAARQGFQLSKHPALQQVKPRESVRTKLTRTSESKYNWECAGEDIDGVAKATGS